MHARQCRHPASVNLQAAGTKHQSLTASAGAYPARRRFIGIVLDVAKCIEGILHADAQLTLVVRTVGVSKNFDSAPIVALDDFRQQIARGVRADIARHVTYSQSCGIRTQSGAMQGRAGNEALIRSFRELPCARVLPTGIGIGQGKKTERLQLTGFAEGHVLMHGGKVPRQA